MKIALLCGGPSLERGISLNSARSVLDHLGSDDIEIVPIYFDSKKCAYRVSKAQLYSNTPSDFDFKLKIMASPLSETALIRLLKNVDLVFPAMHGPYGEDGGIQSLLEKHSIPFVGSDSKSCKMAFDKFSANTFIGTQGFFTLPSVCLKIYNQNHATVINAFFKEHKLTKAIIKPATGGSSIGVFCVSTPKEALDKARFLFSKRMDTRLVLEPVASGIEFTTIVLQNKHGLPVALPPTEIETDYSENQIFDFRKKYLPTHQVIWHCPPRFPEEVIERIQAQAEQIFSLFKMRDFARFDGWVLPDGNIWFCDFNTISGMEQNSFLFQQASRIGLTHASVLRYIVKNACKRHQVVVSELMSEISSGYSRRPVNIIFGGDTSERQVSLMSGTNVWLKLRKSDKYNPQPFMLDTKGEVWRVPYQLALNHTIEEILENCERYSLAKERLASFEKRTRIKLGLESEVDKNDFFEPQKMSLTDFVKISPFVFIALHGGMGEDGSFQTLLDKESVPFNGPNAKVSKLCMDKWATSLFLKNLNIDGLIPIPGTVTGTAQLFRMPPKELSDFWLETNNLLETRVVIVKPRGDGCSTGVAKLSSFEDFEKYLEFMRNGKGSIPKGVIKNRDVIELPPKIPAELLFEKFIETDKLKVANNKLKHVRKTGWLEITAGVLKVEGKIIVFNPSITIVESGVLTVEEKFQGGTGVNITPPPPIILKQTLLKRVKDLIHKVAKGIGIDGYARVDAFMNVNNGDLMIIEINTLPGLTPSTVLYQQALAENPPIFPTKFLETVIENKGY